mmetsp:Transcript_32549/g.51815  ORF Transcript_32549/g.51815 Transcript_32549/m.51815 type:complete len:151 (-) Transcript_32549:123-575(-)
MHVESKFEGKFAENKEGEEEEWVLPGCGEDTSVVARAALWAANPEKKKKTLRLLDDFARENCHLFEKQVGADPNDGTGYSLENDDAHKRYLALFENEMEDFIREEGFTMEDFEKDCEAIQNGKSITLFENEDHKWFLDGKLLTEAKTLKC